MSSSDVTGPDALVSRYLSAGGLIRKIPEAVPVMLGDVLKYLEARRIEVEVVRSKVSGAAPKYWYRGETLSQQALVQLANVHRCEDRLAPFEVKSKSSGWSAPRPPRAPTTD
jgi:hypothetical protein